MAAPTYVGSAEGVSWDSNGSATRTCTISVQVGDILVLVGVTEDRTRTLSITTAAGQTWTLQQDSGVIASRCRNYLWTATSVTAGSIAVTTTCNTSAVAHGAELHVFRGSDGVGNSTVSNAAGDDPSFSLTTTQGNSAIVMSRTDWNAADTATATYRTGAGTFTETTYFRNSTIYTTANGYHADAGAAAAKTLGHTTTGTVTETWIYAAVEVKGSAAGGGTTVKQFAMLGVG